MASPECTLLGDLTALEAAEPLPPGTGTGAVPEPSAALSPLTLYCHSATFRSQVGHDFVTERTIKYFSLS